MHCLSFSGRLMLLITWCQVHVGSGRGISVSLVILSLRQALCVWIGDWGFFSIPASLPQGSQTLPCIRSWSWAEKSFLLLSWW